MTFETSDSIKVSIIIPTKNNGNIIERGLRSIINPFRKESFCKEKERIINEEKGIEKGI